MICVDQTGSLDIAVRDTYYVVGTNWFIFYIGMFYLVFGAIDWLFEKAYYGINSWILYSHFVLFTAFIIGVKLYTTGAWSDILVIFVVLIQIAFIINAIYSLTRNIRMKFLK